ncbi:protein translocase subunit SecF [Tyzzerella sp. An114]|uniref:protein translocase subunit SecF n=1 Tax=Tyzzerella sp. An114 TaxID=1965545 RepID=UPI000B451D6E|nr:protein translocase subunit SecF [Tyzzerella sp. An114]OUQ58766.1 protein translocase subunit SecF [Tyzzerella sp. An114]
MDIIKNRKKFFAVSLIIICIGIVTMIINSVSGKGALNYDVEFTGGTSMDIDIGGDFRNSDISDIIKDVTGQSAPQVQRVTGTNEVSIKMQSIDSETRTALIEALNQKYTDMEVHDVSDVGGTISGEMQRAALLAILVSCGAMLVYISIRFKDFRAGASAIFALVHDVLVVLAFYAVLRIPVNNSFIAAILTVLGYSINATIVIFDRIRENKSNFRVNETADKINKSVIQTLARSVNTSLTTLFTIGTIYILGVQSIKEFALPLIIGIISGAYSSIFLAGAVWYMLIPKNEK